MTRGRRLLLAVLQRTSHRAMAARCRVYDTRILEWANGHRLPSLPNREALERNYGIPVNSWDVAYVRVVF